MPIKGPPYEATVEKLVQQVQYVTVRTDNDIHLEESAQEQPMIIQFKIHGCGNSESNTGTKGEDNTSIISENPSVMQREKGEQYVTSMMTFENKVLQSGSWFIRK